jgi:hypothetical protein
LGSKEDANDFFVRATAKTPTATAPAEFAYASIRRILSGQAHRSRTATAGWLSYNPERIIFKRTACATIVEPVCSGPSF